MHAWAEGCNEGYRGPAGLTERLASKRPGRDGQGLRRPVIRPLSADSRIDRMDGHASVTVSCCITQTFREAKSAVTSPSGSLAFTTPMGQDTPVPCSGQYPYGFLASPQVLLVVVRTVLEAQHLPVAGIPASSGYPGNMPDSPRTLTAALHREEDWYIAQCLEVDVASQGHTIDEALANLAEAVELYLGEVDDPAGHLTATPLVTSFKLPAA